MKRTSSLATCAGRLAALQRGRARARPSTGGDARAQASFPSTRSPGAGDSPSYTLPAAARPPPRPLVQSRGATSRRRGRRLASTARADSGDDRGRRTRRHRRPRAIVRRRRARPTCHVHRYTTTNRARRRRRRPRKNARSTPAAHQPPAAPRFKTRTRGTATQRGPGAGASAVPADDAVVRAVAAPAAAPKPSSSTHEGGNRRRADARGRRRGAGSASTSTAPCAVKRENVRAVPSASGAPSTAAMACTWRPSWGLVVRVLQRTPALASSETLALDQSRGATSRRRDATQTRSRSIPAQPS